MITIDSGVLVAFGGFALLAFVYWINRNDPPDPPDESRYSWDYKIETKREGPTDG